MSLRLQTIILQLVVKIRLLSTLLSVRYGVKCTKAGNQVAVQYSYDRY